MPRLIHLNGPSGVGKSTLARRYADERPGVLALDIDQLVPFFGGWRDDFARTLGPARRVALAAATAHLSGGHDVVIPQLVTAVEQARRFEEAAGRADAGYVEVALLTGVPEQLARFRGKDRVTDVDRHVRDHLEERGGSDVLARIHRHCVGYLTRRPAALRLDTTGQDPDASYAALVTALTGC